MLLIDIRCTSLNEIPYVLNVQIATQIRNSGEIVCINMKRVCGFAVSYIRDALLRRIAVLRTDRVVLSVSLSVGLSVSHTSGPCKNDRSDRVAVCVEDSGGPKEPCITWGPNPPMGRAILRDKRANHCKV